MTTKKRPATYRLSEEAREIIQRLADLYGISQTAVLELAIREKARRDLQGKLAESSQPAQDEKPKRKPKGK